MLPIVFVFEYVLKKECKKKKSRQRSRVGNVIVSTGLLAKKWGSFSGKLNSRLNKKYFRRPWRLRGRGGEALTARPLRAPDVFCDFPKGTMIQIAKFPNRIFWNFYNSLFVFLFPKLNKLNISAIYEAIIIIFSVNLPLVFIYEFCKEEIWI